MYGMQSKINQILRGAETIRRNSREEWKERAEKAEAEVERLKSMIERAMGPCSWPEYETKKELPND